MLITGFQIHGLTQNAPGNGLQLNTHEMETAAISQTTFNCLTESMQGCRQTIVNHTCKASARLLQCIGCAQGAT